MEALRVAEGREHDPRFCIPKNLSDMSEITTSHIPVNAACLISKIDLETGDIILERTDRPHFPIKIGAPIRFNNGSSSNVLRIVTDNNGRYWMKVESGSYYVYIGGSPRHVHKACETIVQTVRGLLGRKVQERNHSES
jgi:hypothetical protein